LFHDDAFLKEPPDIREERYAGCNGRKLLCSNEQRVKAREP